MRPSWPPNAFPILASDGPALMALHVPIVHVSYYICCSRTHGLYHLYDVYMYDQPAFTVTHGVQFAAVTFDCACPV